MKTGPGEERSPGIFRLGGSSFGVVRRTFKKSYEILGICPNRK